MAQSEKPCPALGNKLLCHECSKVENHWDINRLLADLARAKAEQDFAAGKGYHRLKSRELSPHQICWLLLLLAGLSVEQIEFRLNRSRLTTDLSKTLFKYVTRITGKKVNHWAQLRLYIEQAGYRKGVSIEEDTLEIKIVIKMPISSFNQSLEELVTQLNQVIGKGTMTLETSYEQVKTDNEPKSNER